MIILGDVLTVIEMALLLALLMEVMVDVLLVMIEGEAGLVTERLL